MCEFPEFSSKFSVHKIQLISSLVKFREKPNTINISKLVQRISHEVSVVCTYHLFPVFWADKLFNLYSSFSVTRLQNLRCDFFWIWNYSMISHVVEPFDCGIFVLFNSLVIGL